MGAEYWAVITGSQDKLPNEMELVPITEYGSGPIPDGYLVFLDGPDGAGWYTNSMNGITKEMQPARAWWHLGHVYARPLEVARSMDALDRYAAHREKLERMGVEK